MGLFLALVSAFGAWALVVRYSGQPKVKPQLLLLFVRVPLHARALPRRVNPSTLALPTYVGLGCCSRSTRFFCMQRGGVGRGCFFSAYHARTRATAPVGRRWLVSSFTSSSCNSNPRPACLYEAIHLCYPSVSTALCSLAGLIARSALLEAAMAPYLSSLQCFVTLACPHLGQTSTPLSFFKTGAWAVRKVRPDKRAQDRSKTSI